MTPTAKFTTSILAGVGVIGGGAGAFYAKQHFSQNDSTSKITIQKELESKGKILLNDKSSPTRWEIKLNTYQKQKANLSLRLNKEDVITLVETCKSKLTSEFNTQNEKLYEDLEKICTSPTNRERFSKDSKDFVPDAQGWEAKATNYKSKSGNTNAIPGIDKETATKEAIQAWCNKEIEKEYEDDDHYSNILTWCSTQGS